MKKQSPLPVRSGAPGAPPYVGALLRQCWQKVRVRLANAVREGGFTDLQEAHFPVFSYPLPEAVRPSDLARQLGMTRQAANYLVGQLEDLGYLERRGSGDTTRRLIHLTEKGWSVIRLMWSTLDAIHAEWAGEVGEQRFATFLAVLRDLASREG